MFQDWLRLSGRSTKEIALELGVSYQAVNHWIRGVSIPRSTRLARLEDMSGGLVTAKSFARCEGVGDAEANCVAQ
jgi:transcriptional regulator with XRE-family HTH domain